MNTPSQWQYFSKEELTCHCGKCGRMDMDSEFMNKIVAMRRELGFPFIVTSAFRCPEYNAKPPFTTGENGPHTTGHAMDLLVSHEGALRVVDSALRHGMTGIGVKQHGPGEARYLHLDDLEAPDYPRPNLWSYP